MDVPLMGIMKALQLSLLRGRDQSLHNRISQGYARGDYQAAARREQQEVRRQIRNLEAEK
jgi:hypothetical protein